MCDQKGIAHSVWELSTRETCFEEVVFLFAKATFARPLRSLFNIKPTKALNKIFFLKKNHYLPTYQSLNLRSCAILLITGPEACAGKRTRSGYLGVLKWLVFFCFRFSRFQEYNIEKHISWENMASISVISKCVEFSSIYNYSRFYVFMFFAFCSESGYILWWLFWKKLFLRWSYAGGVQELSPTAMHSIFLESLPGQRGLIGFMVFCRKPLQNTTQCFDPLACMERTHATLKTRVKAAKRNKFAWRQKDDPYS